MNQEKLGKFLVTLRKEKGLKQKDVARQICVTEQAVSKWERGLGFPDISLWNSICEVYDISLIELLNCERYEKTVVENSEKDENDENNSKKEEDYEKEKKLNALLTDTVERSNDKINKIEFKTLLILIGLTITIYVISLAINSVITNYLLFILATVIFIYFLGIVLKKFSYLKKFLIATLILILIILGYSCLEKISINRNYRIPIFAIKEIYKEYNITVYRSIFYSAYSCDDTEGDLSLLSGAKIEHVCATGHLTDSENKRVLLKSGATVSQEQLYVLQNFQDELFKQGYVDYNYMRETDLKNFWNYIDENHYCSNNYNNNPAIVIKRKNGVCQYNDDEFYYCIVYQEDDTIKYKSAINRSCK